MFWALLTYPFHIIHWTERDITGIQRKTIKLLTSAIFHHPKAAFQMLTLLRTYRGRGLIDINNLLNKQKKTILKECVIKRRDTFLLHHAIVNTDKNYSPLNLSGEGTFVVTPDRDKWLALNQKALHGKHAHALTQPYVDHYHTECLVDLGWAFPCNGGF